MWIKGKSELQCWWWVEGHVWPSCESICPREWKSWKRWKPSNEKQNVANYSLCIVIRRFLEQWHSLQRTTLTSIFYKKWIDSYICIFYESNFQDKFIYMFVIFPNSVNWKLFMICMFHVLVAKLLLFLPNLCRERLGESSYPLRKLVPCVAPLNVKWFQAWFRWLVSNFFPLSIPSH
jgi:hypothetical protein